MSEPRSLLTMRHILDFETAADSLRLTPELKAYFVREDFGCSMTRYHQALVSAISIPDAAIYAPQLVARLRRLRDERRIRRNFDATVGPAARRDPRQKALL